MNKNKKSIRASLNSEGCLSLTTVLHSFSAGVSEEQAWALCYQTVKTAQLVLNSGDRDRTLLITSTDHVKLHQDGSIHKSTFLQEEPSDKEQPRDRSSDERKIISQLVHVVYEALEYGMEEDAERVLSPELAKFIEKMVSADEGSQITDDEGYPEEDDEEDFDDRIPQRFGFQRLLKICRDRISSPTRTISGSLSSLSLQGSGSNSGSYSAATDNHYKAVIRALVAETLELSTFLEKVVDGSVGLRNTNSSRLGQSSCDGSGEYPDLEQLHFSVWIRLWVQVMSDLRKGVKLKKVENFDAMGRGPQVEYELTPYEILMDEIRSRRYQLNKVKVDGELPPRVKRSAHELIMDFIRGRPPLRKASDRVLPPAPKKPLPPVEALMESIRSRDRKSLKPTHTIVRNSLSKESFRSRPLRHQSDSLVELRTESSADDSISSVDLNTTLPTLSTPQRRRIKVDLDALYGEDDSDDDEQTQVPVTKDSYFGHIFPDQPRKTRTDIPIDYTLDRRRHTICNPTLAQDHGTMMITFPLEYTNNSLNMYNSLNRLSVSPVLVRRKHNFSGSMSKSALQEEFFQSNQWQKALECLSLNLEEVVHIRNVLTKIELESLPVDCSTKDDVEKGKVCFLCLKTRFGLLGLWSNCCKLCKRMVCAKCCSKMRIPTEHFANIPVSTLSPLLSPTREEDSPSHTPGKSPSPVNTLYSAGRKNSVGSAPTSPALSRKSDDSGQRSISPALDPEKARDRVSLGAGDSGPYSLPAFSSISLGLQALKRRSFGRKKEDVKTEKLMGQLMVVCHDCKAMVLQIIRSSRVKKGQSIRANMTLDLPQLHTLA